MQLIWEYLLSGLLLIYATKLYESFSKKYTTIQTPNPARVPVQERIDACNEEIANTEKDFLVVQEILAQITPLLNEHQEKTKARYAWLLSEMKSDPVTP